MKPLRLGWAVAIAVSVAVVVAVRLWNGITGPLLRGYDDHGHVGYVLFLDLYRSLPWADQGWSYFHPPLHYLLGLALAQLGSAQALLHGLALLNGLWSLVVALLAARLVAAVHPGRVGLPLLVFVSIGLLPVYLYTGTTAGNELTATFFGTLGFGLLVLNEMRERPELRSDALVGLLIGLALLSKVSAVQVLGAAGLTLGFRLSRAESLAYAMPRLVVRGLVLAGVALAVASPYYLRNVSEFGTPLKMSRDNPHVARLESLQAPGSRSWVDFVHLPPELLSDPNPRAEHLLHSVWGSAYAQTWSDPRLSWDNLPAREQPRIRALRSLMVVLGLGPTLLALLGSLLAFADVVRGRRQPVYVPMFCIAFVSLASFGYFAVEAPMYSALKASYLLGLTLPYGLFLARGIEFLAGGSLSVWRRSMAGAVVAIPALASAFVHSDGVLLPRLGDHKALASVFFYFGDFEAADRLYREQRRSLLSPKGAVNAELGSLALVGGDPFEARSLLESIPSSAGRKPFRSNMLAVAAALAGDTTAARRILDDAIERGAGEVALTNRGALRASLGDLDGAEADLRAALERDDALAPTWQAIAEVLLRKGQKEAAAEARARSLESAALAPRHYPYGVPNGLGQYPSFSLGVRFMLWLEGQHLALARAPFRAEDVIEMRDPESIFATRPHIVLIVIDTLRADHLGAYGYHRPTSPTIDGLADEGVRFSNVSAPSSWTLPSVASLFTSQTPDDHRANAWGRKLDAAATTFVERLASAGYRTLGVSGNFVHISEKTRFDQGFEFWQTLKQELGDEPAEALLEQKGVRLRAATASEINAAVLDALPAPSPHPLFLYVHYMEPHSDYAPPEAKRLEFTSDPANHDRPAPVTSAFLGQLVRGEVEIQPDERQRVIDLYDAEIATVDEEIGELLGALRARGFGDKLVVAVTSDHGEAFGEHESWFHGLNLHGESLSVPFIVWDARNPRHGEVVDTPSDLLDVSTTLLALAGVEPAFEMSGRDLLRDGRHFPRALFASLGRDRLFEGHLRPRTHKRAATLWPWKILVDAGWASSLYDLEQDPEELTPLRADDPRVPAHVRKQAKQLSTPKLPRKPGKKRPGRPGARSKGVDGEREAVVPTDKEREQLRALGYAE